jgi:flagellar hook assembly protein FlgD
MPKQDFKLVFYWIISMVIILGLSVSFQSLLAAIWTPPSATPPGDNVFAPLNEGNLFQVKTGPLQIATGALEPQTAFTVTNQSGAASFTVEDEAGDLTPFVIDADGQVGIGTIAPNKQLHVKTAGGNAEIDIQSGGTNGDGSHWGIYHDATSDDLKFFKDAANRLVITDDGRVAIGQNIPDGDLKLDVEGKIGATEYCDQDGGNCKSVVSLGGGSGAYLGDEWVSGNICVRGCGWTYQRCPAGYIQTGVGFIGSGGSVDAAQIICRKLEAYPYYWSEGAWSTCSPCCPVDVGTQTRTVVCKYSLDQSTVDDSFCSAYEPKPSASQTCGVACTYSWHDNGCSATCGGGTINYVCWRDCDSVIVANSFCGGTPPVTACNTACCPYNNACSWGCCGIVNCQGVCDSCCLYSP